MIKLYTLLVITAAFSANGDQESVEYYPVTTDLTQEQCHAAIEERVNSSHTGPLLMSRMIAVQTIFFDYVKEYPSSIISRYSCNPVD